MHIPGAMIRKRIEIVSLVGGLSLAVALGGYTPGPVQAARGSGYEPERQSRTFPVYVSPSNDPVELPPLPGVEPSAVQVSIRQDDSSAETAPDIPYSYFWEPEDGMRLRSAAYARRREVSDHSPGLFSGFEQPRVTTPRSRWLPTPAMESWNFGERSWQTRLDQGPEVLLGSSEIAVPEWNESVRLGGISLSQSFLASSDDVSQWNYALAFGAVDQSDPTRSGDLVFGPTAGSLAVSYDYSPSLSVESHTEVAADLLMSGITGQYDLGQWGRWRSGIARSDRGMRQGWRYRAMADFDLAADMRLAWVGERYTEGFTDIRRYAAGGNPVSGGRQRWSASWDVGRWGTWSGSYESLRGREGPQQRRFGVSQQFWYSPNLRVGLHAEREVVAGDYDIGLRFSFPLY